MQPFTCKNCGHSNNGYYCSNCGQKDILELSWRQIARDATDAFEFKKGILYNLKAFSVRPKESIDAYINGQTKKFLNPISYLLFGLGLLFISIQFTGLFAKDAVDDALLKTAERIVYTAGAVFPVIFTFILNLAIVDRRPNLLYGLILSLFLSGHVLIILGIVRAFIFVVGFAVDINPDVGFAVINIIGIGFSYVFSRAFIKMGHLQYFLRMIGSTVVVTICLFVITVVLISFNPLPIPQDEEAIEVGRLLRHITNLLTGIG